MPRVTVDYRCFELDELLVMCRGTWTRRLVMVGIAWLMMLCLLLPIVAWQIWEGRWISLGLLAGLMLFLSFRLNRSSVKQGLVKMRQLPPLTFELQPAGVVVSAEHHLHLLQGWPIFKQVLRGSRAAWLWFLDHGNNLGYFLPQASFANEAACEEFLAAAEHAIENKATAPNITGTNIVTLPATARYEFRYQLTRAELYQDDALKERNKLEPETLNAEGLKTEQATAKQKRMSWVFLAGVATLVILMQFEEELLPLRNREFPLALPAFFSMFAYGFLLSRFPKLLAWIRRRRKSPAPEVEVLLNEEGFFRRSEQERLAIPWSGITALQIHDGRLLLWRGPWLRLIIPQRVFDSPEAAHECERWIQSVLHKQFNRLAVAELAEPEPTIDVPTRPVSNNPYQAPLS